MSLEFQPCTHQERTRRRAGPNSGAETKKTGRLEYNASRWCRQEKKEEKEKGVSVVYFEAETINRSTEDATRQWRAHYYDVLMRFPELCSPSIFLFFLPSFLCACSLSSAVACRLHKRPHSMSQLNYINRTFAMMTSFTATTRMHFVALFVMQPDLCHARAILHKRKNTECNSLPQSILVVVVK